MTTSRGWNTIGLLLTVLAVAACGSEATGTPTPVPADTASPRTGDPVGDPVDAEPAPDLEAEREAERERARERERERRERERERERELERERERERERREAAARAAADAPVTRRPVPVLPGAILPRERIVAFYGSPASTRMGILGELPPDEMLARLDREVAEWRRADPSRPVQPALHMIAVMAAGDPGPDSLYRIRMPERRIESVMDWADRRDAIVFLDIQPGRSSVARELPRLRKWLTRPDVHLGLDPEWAMPAGVVPGRQIGSMTAADINRAIDFLAEIVEEHDLPPKVLVVHRFTQGMVRNAATIRRDPRVQVVMNMDGWGPPSQKRIAYRDIVAPEADQFLGFKLFYKNDVRGGSRMMTPEEILQLTPAPIYIQYQ